MDQTTKHTLNRQLRQPVYAILAAALVMLLCVFLPYGTATGERARLDRRAPGFHH